ncbi:hypothetical protein CXB51_005934 [Gossypium anomalum]|uniref:Uncharacterized protein n=1 Tax=Gossypium anomalum TaxID=47600 RepID=A0A8J5Z1R3_9ROSI|nr:hypothetical protein CXB51_005934 [Gossypium anomalum]
MKLNHPPKPRNSTTLSPTKWLTFGFSKLLISPFLIFSLLSTSAVVYTIACIYTARELTFDKVMSVVPKVWKRLMVTFLCTFLTMFVYHVVAIFIMVSSVILLLGTDAVDAVLAILLVLYFVGFLYMTIIWHLASVISVLEECYGFQAMMKGKNLIKGKLWVAIIIFLMLVISLAIIQAAFQSLVVHGSSLGMAMRVVYAIICFCCFRS